jgi:hypothetical protein
MKEDEKAAELQDKVTYMFSTETSIPKDIVRSPKSGGRLRLLFQGS